MYKANAADYKEIASDNYPWEEHGLWVNLASGATTELASAIEVLSGSNETALAATFLQRCIVLCDRVFAEDRLEASGDALPCNRATVLRARAYAKALMGIDLDTDSLLSASSDFEAYARWHNDPRDANQNNEQTRYFWIDSINTALIGGDLARAETLIAAVPKPVRYHKEHLKLLGRLIAFAKDELSDRAEFVDEFNRFFDFARDPTQERPKGYFIRSTIGPLELAILREKYIERPGAPLDWKRVIEAYAG